MIKPTLILFHVFLCCSCATKPPVTHPPEIGGQTVPENNIVIDFRKSYNVYWRNGESVGVIPNARIIGYTGETARDVSGSYSKRYSTFGSWLVIEPCGAGRIYMPQGMVAYLQQNR